MKLQEINKQQYRKHLNIIIIAFIIGLTGLALAYGQALIAIFSEQTLSQQSPSQKAPSQHIPSKEAPSQHIPSQQIPSKEAPSNFKFNLLGVLLALLTCSLVLHRLRYSAFFSEVYYVWQLKQQQNAIYRKLSNIKSQANTGNKQALTILCFYYQSLKQVYLLDDNTLTLSKLENDINQLNQQISELVYTISLDDYQPSMLKQF